MFSTSDLTDRFGVSDTTIRNWARTYAEFLSATANPPKGETREYSDRDALVLATVARESRRRTPAETIRRMLEDGALVEELPEPLPNILGELQARDSKALMRIQSLSLELAEANNKLVVYEHLEGKWKEEKTALQRRVDELLIEKGRLERELELRKSGEL